MEYMIKKDETKGVIITFTPDVKLKEKDTFNLPVQITNGQLINVQCKGHCYVGAITLKNKKEGLIFGKIPIGETMTKQLCMKNPSSTYGAAFEVIQVPGSE